MFASIRNVIAGLSLIAVLICSAILVHSETRIALGQAEDCVCGICKEGKVCEKPCSCAVAIQEKDTFGTCVSVGCCHCHTTDLIIGLTSEEIKDKFKNCPKCK